MNRRDLITLLGGAAAPWPIMARAQQGERARRIGILMGFPEDDPETTARVTKFRRELEKLGWVEGRNVRIDFRFAAGAAHRYQPLAKELIALQPDVILAHTTPVAVALQRETRTIPIVFVNVSDPIGGGFIASLARPGSNLTGVLHYETGIPGKWLAMLKEIAPRIARAAVLANPKSTAYDYLVRSTEAAARKLAIELLPHTFNDASSAERAIEAFAGVPDGGLVVFPDQTTFIHREIIIAQAARHRLPAVYSARFFVVAGGLMSYGTDQVEMFGQTASYVDRILRGANPAILPVQAPTKFETILNVKTAKALGVDVPASLLVRADEVIE